MFYLISYLFYLILFFSSLKNKEKLSTEIFNFFSEYQESNIGKKIPLIIDASILLFTSSKARRNKRAGSGDIFYGDSDRFAYLLTAESISDPSPKKNFTKFQENNSNVFPFTNDNCYIEANNGEREHDYSFEKIKVTLNMNYGSGNNLPTVDIKYETSNKYELKQTLDIGTEAKKHPHSIGKLTKDYRGLTKRLTTANCVVKDGKPLSNDTELKKNLNKTPGGNTFEKFMNWIKSMFSKSNPDDKKLISNFYDNLLKDDDFVCKEIVDENNVLYGEKRCGDQHQGRGLKKNFIDGSGLEFYSKRELHKAGKKNTTKITKAVLVTHDRMLFALALQLDIPVIFDYGTMVLMYNPLAGAPAAGAQSGGGKKTKKKKSNKSRLSLKKKNKERVSGKSDNTTVKST